MLDGIPVPQINIMSVCLVFHGIDTHSFFCFTTDKVQFYILPLSCIRHSQQDLSQVFFLRS